MPPTASVTQDTRYRLTETALERIDPAVLKVNKTDLRVLGISIKREAATAHDVAKLLGEPLSDGRDDGVQVR